MLWFKSLFFYEQGCELFTAVDDIHQPFDISVTSSWIEGQQADSDIDEFLLVYCHFMSSTCRGGRERRKNIYIKLHCAELPRISLLITETFLFEGRKYTSWIQFWVFTSLGSFPHCHFISADIWIFICSDSNVIVTWSGSMHHCLTDEHRGESVCFLLHRRKNKLTFYRKGHL